MVMSFFSGGFGGSTVTTGGATAGAGGAGATGGGACGSLSHATVANAITATRPSTLFMASSLENDA
jgi:hypothetical protein